MRAREARKLTGGEGVETGFRTIWETCEKAQKGAQRCEKVQKGAFLRIGRKSVTYLCPQKKQP